MDLSPAAAKAPTQDRQPVAQHAKVYAGRRVVVTGVAGTVGSHLVAALLASDVGAIVAIDANENELFHLAGTYERDRRFQPYVIDVRDGDQLRRSMRDADYCFHLAGLKHVMLSERSPFSPVHTNVLGSENVIRGALDNRVGRTVFASSDKAVNPTNVMGASKLLAERLFTAANNVTAGREPPSGAGDCLFASLRFGNVAGSRGSVIPVFERQIARGGPVTLTSRHMTRFVITMRQSVEMLLSVLPLAEGGEVFVSKMPVIRVEDLADVLVELLAPVFGRKAGDVGIVETGPKPGEKLYEELTTTEETRRTVEYGDFLVVLPPFSPDAVGETRTFRGQRLALHDRLYNSADEPPLDRDSLRDFLLQPGVLSEELRVRAVEIRNETCAS
jgi:FlaA1/EpsC-like NDP-sugar epimerase